MDNPKVSPPSSTNGSTNTMEFSGLEQSIATNTPRSARKRASKCFPPSRSTHLPPYPPPPSPKTTPSRNYKKPQLSTSTPTLSKLPMPTSRPSPQKTHQYPKSSSSPKNRRALPWSTKDSVLPSRKNSTLALSERPTPFSLISTRSRNFPQ